jgi:hypothetical protein
MVPSEMESTVTNQIPKVTEDFPDNAEDTTGLKQKQSELRTTANSCSNKNSLMYFQSHVHSQANDRSPKKPRKGSIMAIKMKKIESLFSEGEDLYDLLDDEQLIEDYRRFMKRER